VDNEDPDRDRIRHVPPELPWNACLGNPAGGKAYQAMKRVPSRNTLGSGRVAPLIRPNRSRQSDDRRSKVREAKEARSFPRSGCLHALHQPLVRLRRSIQARKELAARFRADRKRRAIEQRTLGDAQRSVQNEIRSVFTGNLRSSIDQFAYLWFDAQVERFAPGGLTLCGTHCLYYGREQSAGHMERVSVLEFQHSPAKSLFL
jgi:hypothetical protein